MNRRYGRERMMMFIRFNPTAEEYMQKYFEVAKKARTAYPGIKLVGPVPANEWQWYNWKGNLVSYNGKQCTHGWNTSSYGWLKKRIDRHPAS